ncbi:MAG: ribonuclease III [Clostridia bacterium]
MDNLEDIIDYHFSNKGYLLLALTHSSFSKENYERLEYLGDCLIGFVVGEYLFNETAYTEGKLSRIRANFVSTQNFSKLFEELHLESFVRLGKSMKNKITKNIKADVFESLMAGIYLDSCFDRVKSVIIRLLNLKEFKKYDVVDFKTLFQEFVQEKNMGKIKYVLKKETIKSHAPFYEIELLLNGECLAKSSGKNKHLAESKCAEVAYEKIVKL